MLGADRVGLDDGFFELGGHSLLATRVMSRIASELGQSVPLRVIFEASQLGAFAEQVRAALAGNRPAQRSIVRADRNLPLPLSPAQLRQWFLWQLDPESSAYHLQAAVKLVGALHVAALERALVALAHRHETLRTRFVQAGGAVHQVIDPPGVVAMAIEDLGGAPEAQLQAALAALARRAPIRSGARAAVRARRCSGAASTSTCSSWRSTTRLRWRGRCGSSSRSRARFTSRPAR